MEMTNNVKNPPSGFHPHVLGSSVRGSATQIDGLMQERHNSSANALELCLSCTNPWRWPIMQKILPVDSIPMSVSDDVCTYLTSVHMTRDTHPGEFQGECLANPLSWPPVNTYMRGKSHNNAFFKIGLLFKEAPSCMEIYLKWIHQVAIHFHLLSQSQNYYLPYGSLESQTMILTHLPWAKWLLFRRRHFQMHFYEWKLLYFDLNFTEVLPEGPIDNKPALVQVMAWHRTGSKPSPEPISQSSLGHICGTRGRWVNESLLLFNGYMMQDFVPLSISWHYSWWKKIGHLQHSQWKDRSLSLKHFTNVLVIHWLLGVSQQNVGHKKSHDLYFNSC